MQKFPKYAKSSLQKENHFLSKVIAFFCYWQMNIFLKLRNMRCPSFSSTKLQCDCLKYHPKVYRSRKKHLGWTYFSPWHGHKSLQTRDCYRTLPFVVSDALERKGSPNLERSKYHWERDVHQQHGNVIQ